MSSSVNLNTPFAQALISEGQRRGYSPLAIAASIGNASTENGLRTNGTPGDNGTAFGGFQWRNDRKANLDRTASQMGTSWDDPRAQAAHWFNEQDGVYGGEKPYGDALKSARTTQEANEAVIRSLRPAGSQNGPRSAHNYAGRMSAVDEAFNLMNGGDGGVQSSPGGPGGASGPGDFRGQPNPDVPADGAAEARYVVPGGLSSKPKGDFDSFLNGGPGAFLGVPQDGWNVGDALMGAGAAMMSRDNPDGAKSLAAMAKLSLEKEEARRKLGALTTEINPQTGRAYQYDRSGNVTVKQLHDPQEKPITDGAVKMIQANNDKAETAWNAADGTRKYTHLLMDGKVDLSALGRMGNEWANFTNDSDEKTRNAAGLMAHIMKMRDARLLEAKGVQTDADAQRALDALLPGSAKYDNKSVATLFKGLSKEFTDTYDQHNRYNQTILTRYKDYDPEGFYKARYDERLKQARDQDARVEGRWGDFVVVKPPAPTTGTPITGRDPMKTSPVPQPSPAPGVTDKPKGSFMDFYNTKNSQR